MSGMLIFGLGINTFGLVNIPAKGGVIWSI